MVQIILIETVKPSIKGRSIKIGEMDCFLLVSESEPVANRKSKNLFLKMKNFISYREESFSEQDKEFHPSSPFQEFMEEDCVSEIKKKSTSNFPYFLSQQDSFLESRIMESQYDIVF
ncbi:hypothetical protein L195_g059476, partial [Trifolium pratense]